MQVGLGIFGKIQSYAEFVSAGTSSATGQSFERWLQMANDQVARAGAELPTGPLGFCYRDASGASVLLGVFVGSCDKVGRRFPLAVFCEVTPSAPVPLGGLAEVLRPLLTQFSMLAMTASQADPPALKKALQGLDCPSAGDLAASLQESRTGLEQVELNRLLERVYPDNTNVAYGTSVLLRGCDRAVSDGVQRTITIDVTVTSDVELSFWLACAEARLAGRLGPVAAFWDVQNRRALIVPGVPDSNTVQFLGSASAQHSKLWRTTTSSGTARSTARDQLGATVCEMLDDPSSFSAEAFIRALPTAGP